MNKLNQNVNLVIIINFKSFFKMIHILVIKLLHCMRY